MHAGCEAGILQEAGLDKLCLSDSQLLVERLQAAVAQDRQFDRRLHFQRLRQDRADAVGCLRIRFGALIPMKLADLRLDELLHVRKRGAGLDGRTGASGDQADGRQPFHSSPPSFAV